MKPKLKKLLAELGRHFGKTTRWRAVCKEQNATTDDERIAVAEQVLQEWSTGTVAELYSHNAKLHGAKATTVQEFLNKHKRNRRRA